MLLIPFTWILILLVLLSLGGGVTSLYTKLTHNKHTSAFSPFHYIWLGYAALIAILQWYSIFFPVDGYALLWIICLALAGIGTSRATISQCMISSVKSLSNGRGMALLGIVLLTLMIAYRASLPLQLYDTELYHLNAVKWASSYPAIPGIVNLHGRLAFNSSFHLFAALLNVGYWSNRTVYVANSFLVFLVCIQWLMTLLAGPSVRLRLSYCFAVVTTPFLILSILKIDVSSLSTDLPTQLLVLVVVFHILEIVDVEGGKIFLSNITGPQDTFCMMFIVTIASVAASSKLSSAIVLTVVAPAVALQLWSTRKLYSSRKQRMRYVITFAPAIIVLSGMMARYVILSGWLVYPFPMGNLHLDWSARPAQVAWELDWIRSWARMPGKLPTEVLGNGFLNWFVPWYDQFFIRNRIAHALLSAGIAGLFYLCSARSAKKYRNSKAAPLLLAIAVTILGLFYWFITAPDYRFGEIFFWSFTGASLAPLVATAVQGHVRGNLLAIAFIIVFLSLQKIQGGFPELLPGKVSLWNLPASKSRKITPVRVKNEQSPPLIAFRPLYGDRCGNSPLPCSPGITPESSIELRVPGELRSGFRIR
jgi:hypothetical protein